MEKCSLGIATNMVVYDSKDNSPTLLIYWIPKEDVDEKNRLGIAITEKRTSIFCPDVPSATNLSNSIHHSEFESLLRDVLSKYIL